VTDLPNPKVGGNRDSHLRGARTSKRERPILELGPLARWSSRAKVVPITGGTRTLFDVVVSWLGPPLPGMPRPRSLPDELGIADAETSYTTDDQELARAVAHAAFDLLRDGQVPLMDELAGALRANRAGWRRPYFAKVGDAGKAIAHGY
jgi:hypothetical protein